MNSLSAVASLAEAALASVLVIVKFNYYHKIILKLNTDISNFSHLISTITVFYNFYYTGILASSLQSVHLL